jgi:hypothetical protein
MGDEPPLGERSLTNNGGARSVENPFCTRRIRPGTAAYCFPPGVTVEDLLSRLRDNSWLGEIIGPHGSGKSALLAGLMPHIENAGWRPVLFELHDGQRRLPRAWKGKIASSGPPAPAIVVVDGYEQLGKCSRFLLKRFCRRRGLGLLVTTHESAGLPEIYRTSTSAEMARRVVDRLLQGADIEIPAAVIDELYKKHGGNMREILFDLYDIFEYERLKKAE